MLGGGKNEVISCAIANKGISLPQKKIDFGYEKNYNFINTLFCDSLPLWSDGSGAGCQRELPYDNHP